MTKQYIADTQSYIHREIMGDHVLIPVGSTIGEFNGVITMNPTAAFIWDVLKSPIEKEDLINQLMESFEVEQEVLEADLDEILDTFLNRGMVRVL